MPATQRRKRCAGPCGELKAPSELTQLGRRWLCEDCLHEEADAAIERAADGVEAAADPGADGTARPDGLTPEAAAQGTVIMYATPGMGDGTPVNVKISDVPLRLMEGFGILRADADRAGVSVGDVGGQLRAYAYSLDGDVMAVPGIELGPGRGHEGAPLPTNAPGETPATDGPPMAAESGAEGGDGETSSFLPAPTIRADADMPDLRTDEEKERAWHELPDVKVEGWPLKRGRISASALSTFARCPEQFRRKHIKGEPDPVGGAGLTGTAVHKALSRNWLYKMANGEDASLLLIEEGFDAAFDHAVAREEKHSGAVDWGHDGTKQKERMTSDLWRARGKAATGAYMLQVAGGIWPRSCESLFVEDVSGVPVPVIGFIDLITDRAMVDTKFGGKKQRIISNEWRIQGLTYLLAEDKPMEWHSMNWKGEYHTPADAPGLVMHRTPEAYAIALDFLRSMVAGILSYAKEFGTDDPWPGAISHTWACNTCSFEPVCWWWHRPFFGDASGGLL
jgi:hypothetical protein